MATPIRAFRGNSRTSVGYVLALLPAALWASVIIIPLLFLVLASLKTPAQFASDPLGLPEGVNLTNYFTAWNQGNLSQAFLNTIVITLLSVAGVVLLASTAAYSIVRWVGKLGPRAYLFFALGLIVPFQLGLPTLYKLWAQLGLVDSLVGVIAIQIGAGIPLAVFLYAGFLRAIPLELEEAARIDGAGDVRVFFSIVFPLTRPVTATVAILTSIGVWNDLIVSLYFLQSPTTQTVPKAIIGFQSSFNNDLPLILACAVLSVIPIAVLFISLQKSFLSGLSAGALRG
jgi:raffinose/stachyose/melibiose transport system permease protein